MTESEWLTCGDPGQMLPLLRGKATDRKLRLFAAACGRYLWADLTDDRSRRAVVVAERFADGQATERELQDAASAARGSTQDSSSIGSAADAADVAAWTASSASGYAIAFHVMIAGTADLESQHQAALLRDIFGPLPFRPCTLDRAWLTSTVEAIAIAIYQDYAFDRLPILADALEDAGCTNAEILNHCRQNADHHRGCWALDLILGKT